MSTLQRVTRPVFRSAIAVPNIGAEQICSRQHLLSKLAFVALADSVSSATTIDLNPHEVPRTPSAAGSPAPRRPVCLPARRQPLARRVSALFASIAASPPGDTVAHCLPLIALQPSHDLSQPPPLTATRLCLCHVLRASNHCRPNHSTNPGPTTALATSRDHSPNVRTGLQWQHPSQLSVSRPCPSFSKPQAGRPRPQISLDQDTAPEPWRSANLGLALTLA